MTSAEIEHTGLLLLLMSSLLKGKERQNKRAKQSLTCIIDTVGSILGGSGSLMQYLTRSTPTRMPSSMSVGATVSARLTTNLAYCRTLIMYLSSRP